ncbi:hypothetical protein [Chryseobacterium sp. MFBS3-17]|uniref:hypothetical protein n=1 Tax=Chryseobacterium sp. MFBS3-17 TaxID=2886689 RepID=UPI001D0EA111|nr:hypothetical protein [Chryseobacterium sp. MFBS3-17]MCC2590324.1 hypothetical protein [Chryseobacterium sp. MFBS3-17]
MPHLWNNSEKVAVEVSELVPDFYSSQAFLSKEISRNRENPYGIKSLQRGCRGRRLLIDFDTLPKNIQDALGDPRHVEHVLLYWYKTEAVAVDFYTNFLRPDGMHLNADEIQRYVTNASVLMAVLQLRKKHVEERIRAGLKLTGLNKFLSDECNSFNEILQKKFGVQHNLPGHHVRFKNDALDPFEQSLNYEGTDWPFNFMAIIKDIEGKRKKNALIVDDRTEAILTGLFKTQAHKPTVLEIHRSYEAFLAGYIQVYNEDSGEVYEPKEFPKLSESTVRNWLTKWENMAATYKARSGDRQKYMTKFKPYHQLERPKFAGSLISIDDRNPPFKDLDGNRIWFYNGIDLASEVFTTFVYGKTKEGIILEFYRQMVRNYTEWGISLPDGLEAESALNSSFSDTFLQEGHMFQNVRIEANNARGKRIERYFRTLRYEVEKQREGWLARPHAKSESNQMGAQKVPQLPYEDIVAGCIQDLFDWNNSPHSKDPSKTRWEYFLENQHPELRPTNWKSILPHLGYRQPSSCNAGYVNLQGKARALAINGEIATGETLIHVMKQIEGKEVEIFWLDDNRGGVLKALAYYEGRFVCELMEMPVYNRAIIERTPEQEEARELQSTYENTVTSFIRRQEKQLANINIISQPKPAPKNGFYIPGMSLNRFTPDTDEAEIIEQPDEDEDFAPVAPNVSWQQSFFK